MIDKKKSWSTCFNIIIKLWNNSTCKHNPKWATEGERMNDWHIFNFQLNTSIIVYLLLLGIRNSISFNNSEGALPFDNKFFHKWNTSIIYIIIIQIWKTIILNMYIHIYNFYNSNYIQTCTMNFTWIIFNIDYPQLDPCVILHLMLIIQCPIMAPIESMSHEFRTQYTPHTKSEKDYN